MMHGNPNIKFLVHGFYVGKDVGGDQFSLPVVPVNRVDAV